MEFDFEEGMNGGAQPDVITPDHHMLQQQEPSAGPMDTGHPFDQQVSFPPPPQHQQPQQQHPQQQPQQPQQPQPPPHHHQQQIPGPSSQSLREAREAGGQVYIANLSWWTTDVEVEGLCASFGALAGFQFVEDRSTGRSKGVVLVEFAEPEAAARCKEQLSGKQINGRSCVVTFAGGSGSRDGGGKAGPSHRTGGPTPPPFQSGPREGGGEGRGGRYGVRVGRGGRGGRGADRGDRGVGVGGGGFGGGVAGQMPQDMAPLGMPPMGPGMGPMGGMGPHGGNIFGAAMAAAAAGGGLGLLPGLLGAAAGGVGHMGMGGMGGGHHGMGGPVGPHGHPMGGPRGHFMPDM